MTGTIFDDMMVYISNFIENYGWPILFSIIALYFARPYISEISRKISLASANNKSRRALLDEEKKRARVVQQLNLYKANRDSKDFKAI